MILKFKTDRGEGDYKKLEDVEEVEIRFNDKTLIINLVQLSDGAVFDNTENRKNGE